MDMKFLRNPRSYKEDGRPSQQWYWDDWFSAFDVRMCSLAARGLWVDMIGIMFKAEIRGTLTVNGKQINGKALAKILGEDEREVEECLKELEENNVYSRLEDGTIICRRMFNESKKKEDISRIRSEAGKKGAESRWQNGNKEDSKNIAKEITNDMPKMAASSPSSSPTSSSSSKDNDFVIKFEKLFEEFWQYWPEERRSKKPHCRTKFRALVKTGKLEKFWQTTKGYSEYIEYQKKVKNFNQEVMLSSTWLNNWEDESEKYKDFKYKQRL